MSRTLLDDAASLSSAVNKGEEVLASLPGKRDRDSEQQALAEVALLSEREARKQFLGRHSSAVYADLTEGYTRSYRIAELVRLAENHFPGLVPGHHELAAERACNLDEKEGRELDLALVLRNFLLCNEAGPHLVNSMLLPTPRAQELLGEFSANGALDLGTVCIERRDRAAYITIQNLNCLNSEDVRLVEDMETAVDLALLHSGIQVGLVRGAEMVHPKYVGKRVFSSGVNLKALKRGELPLIDFFLGRELGFISKIRRGLLSSPTSLCDFEAIEKPWVAAVESFAIGGGMQLLFAFDHVIAAEDSYFSLPASQEGLVPGMANLRIGRFTGGRLARRTILQGRKIWATEPAASLICDEVVPSNAIDTSIERAIQNLGGTSVLANRKMLNYAEEPLDEFRRYIAEFAVVQAGLLHSAEVRAHLTQPQLGPHEPPQRAASV